MNMWGVVGFALVVTMGVVASIIGIITVYAYWVGLTGSSHDRNWGFAWIAVGIAILTLCVFTAPFSVSMNYNG